MAWVQKPGILAEIDSTFLVLSSQ